MSHVSLTIPSWHPIYCIYYSISFQTRFHSVSSVITLSLCTYSMYTSCIVVEGYFSTALPVSCCIQVAAMSFILMENIHVSATLVPEPMTSVIVPDDISTQWVAWCSHVHEHVLSHERVWICYWRDKHVLFLLVGHLKENMANTPLFFIWTHCSCRKNWLHWHCMCLHKYPEIIKNIQALYCSCKLQIARRRHAYQFDQTK